MKSLEEYAEELKTLLLHMRVDGYVVCPYVEHEKEPETPVIAAGIRTLDVKEEKEIALVLFEDRRANVTVNATCNPLS